MCTNFAFYTSMTLLNITHNKLIFCLIGILIMIFTDPVQASFLLRSKTSGSVKLRPSSPKGYAGRSRTVYATVVSNFPTVALARRSLPSSAERSMDKRRLAEREGFEPSRPELPRLLLSRQAL